jgi:hypothetical protein
MQLDALNAAVSGWSAAHIDLIKAAVLGIVEGLTEYLPVSSTGHLLLMEHLFGWGDDAFGKSFAVLIQLGAILALLSIYFGRLLALAKDMFTSWPAARFVIGVLLAFLPAAVIGALAYHYIKSYLFDVRVAHCRRFRSDVGRPAELAGALSRSYRLSASHVSWHRDHPVHFDDSRCLASGRDDRRCDAVRRRSPLGGGVFFLACDADHGRCIRL